MTLEKGCFRFLCICISLVLKIFEKIKSFLNLLLTKRKACDIILEYL